MIAEFTAALCAHLGIKGELRHAGYIENWLDLLRHDDCAIFTAASKALAGGRLSPIVLITFGPAIAGPFIILAFRDLRTLLCEGTLPPRFP